MEEKETTKNEKESVFVKKRRKKISSILKRWKIFDKYIKENIFRALQIEFFSF